MTTEIKDRPGTETEATGQELQPFEFQSHQVRVVVIDGEPWFVLTDLCRVPEGVLFRPGRPGRARG